MIDEETTLKEAAAEVSIIKYEDITPKLTPFCPSWDKLIEAPNTVEKGAIRVEGPGEIGEKLWPMPAPTTRPLSKDYSGVWERYYTLTMYLGKLVVGGPAVEQDFKQMGEFIEMLINEGLVAGRLTDPISIPLARGSGIKPQWFPRNELGHDGHNKPCWHRSDTNVAVQSVNGPTLCGFAAGIMTLGIAASTDKLNAEQLLAACPECLKHDKEGTSVHTPTPERYMLLCYLHPSYEVTKQSGEHADAATMLNERFGFDYFTKEGEMPKEWPLRPARPKT
jgi:hypothetical protein